MSNDVVLLRRAVDYALAAFGTVTPDLLSRKTPCSKWNLRMLLGHVCTSVTALQEGLNDGRVALFPMDDDAIPADPTGLARLRVTRLLDEWVSASDDGIVAVADQQMPLSLMTGVAALEIAVHGWDVAQASGHDRPIPPDLAADLLAISRLLVPDGNRRDLFAPPVATSATASPGEELVGYLGRPVAAAAD